jgi:very-short-patch-repair endonuclease
MPQAKKDTVRRARELRLNSTYAEKKLWQQLRDHRVNGWQFRRQHPIPPYFADFACVEARLIVEADGGQHAESTTDGKRTAYLVKRGWRVLRFWNNEIVESLDNVVEVIVAALGPHPNPPPLRGRGSKATLLLTRTIQEKKGLGESP